jgi:plastocyanin
MTAVAIERTTRELTWRSLLRAAALGQSVGLGAAGVMLGDAEAVAIGVATILVLVLHRFRARTGAVLLGFLFADTAFFTGLAAIANLADRAAAPATIGPATLAAIAIAGLVASVVTVWHRGKTSPPTRATMAIAFAVPAAVAIVAIVSLASSRGVSAVDSDAVHRPAPGPAPTLIRLEIKGARYSTEVLTATSRTVTVAVTNHDLFWHTFTIGALGVDLRVPVGDEKSVTFTAAPGTYQYICGVPGHASFMRGVLTVP